MKKRYWIILILILVMQMALRIPFLQEPLEGDEGFYAYFGQSILAGEIPYRDFFDHKPPVVYYINALIFKLFGESLLSIRLFAAFFSLLGTLGLFMIGYKLWRERAGLFVAVLYALFSGGPLIEGTSSNTESFMIVFAIFALLAYILALKNNSGSKVYGLLLLSGFFSGLAVMTKQVALFNFLILLAFLLPYRDFKAVKQWIKSICLTAGFLITPLIFSIYFWANNGLSDFINFAFLFNLGYVQGGWDLLLLVATFYIAICENSIIWVLALAAVFYIMFYKRSKRNVLIILWAIFSYLGVALGGHCFGHYYIQIIPALCLLSGYALSEIRFKKLSLNISAIVLLLFLFLVIALNVGEFYLRYSPEEISIHKYRHPYNVIAKELGQEIKKRTRPVDYILQIGLPQMHFYSRRRSPTKYYFLASAREYGVYLFGQKIFTNEFAYRINEKLYRRIVEDFIKGLRNDKTKFAIFASRELIPKSIIKELRNNFIFSRELSGGGGTVLVFERKKE